MVRRNLTATEVEALWQIEYQKWDEAFARRWEPIITRMLEIATNG